MGKRPNATYPQLTPALRIGLCTCTPIAHSLHGATRSSVIHNALYPYTTTYASYPSIRAKAWPGAWTASTPAVDSVVALCHHGQAKPSTHNGCYAAGSMNAKQDTQERRKCAAPQCARTVPASRGGRAKTCSKACGVALRNERMRAYNRASRARRRAANAIAVMTWRPKDPAVAVELERIERGD